MNSLKKIFKSIKLIRSVPFQILAIIWYIDILLDQKSTIEVGEPNLAFITFLVKVAVMIALSLAIQALSSKPKIPSPQHAKPVGLEQFDFPTAQEGRPIQVLFGKKYIDGPNVVWYGDLRTSEIWS